MAADRSDEPGVLGNLPRSRPGHRSDKRGGVRAAATATAADAVKATDRKPPAARAAKPAAGRAKPAATRSRPARRKPAATSRPKAEPRREPAVAETSAPQASDPLTGAVRLAGKVAETGLKAAGGLLRRLPGR